MIQKSEIGSQNSEFRIQKLGRWELCYDDDLWRSRDALVMLTA
jgi:hypothetical protein